MQTIHGPFRIIGFVYGFLRFLLTAAGPLTPWQMLFIGTYGAIATFPSHACESALAGLAAIAIVAAVVVGFWLRPSKEAFYLRTTVRVPDPDFAVVVEHDQLSIRVELARLWLLFITTFTGVAFLLINFAHGTTWTFSLMDSTLVKWIDIGPYPVQLLLQLPVMVVFGVLTAWISERWVLRDANVCSADSVQHYKNGVRYSFRDCLGEYYGGDGIPVGPTRSPRLRTIVLYRGEKPHFNKIAMCCLFHRLVIVSRGMTDLDEATEAVKSVEAQPVSQPL